MNPHHRWDAMPSARRRTILVVAAALTLVLLVAVPVGMRTVGSGSRSGVESSQTSASAAALAPQRGSAGSADAPAPASPDAAATPGGTSAPMVSPVVSPVTATRIARSAWLGVEVGDLAAASTRARAVAAAAGGQVTAENVVTEPAGDTRPRPDTGSSGDGRTSPRLPSPEPTADHSAGSSTRVPDVAVDEARLVLSVPSQRLDGALTELSRLGTVAYRSSQARDLTDSYVDTRARLDPMKDSVARVQALLADATDLKAVVLIEGELGKRQAELDSLTQRMAELERQTSMSDVTLTLWTPATAQAATEENDNDFASGLSRAWSGLLGSVTVIVAGLATLLPWLALLALVGWVTLRARRRSALAGAVGSHTSTGPGTAGTGDTASTTRDPG